MFAIAAAMIGRGLPSHFFVVSGTTVMSVCGCFVFHSLTLMSLRGDDDFLTRLLRLGGWFGRRPLFALIRSPATTTSASLTVFHEKVRKWTREEKQERPISGNVKPVIDGHVNEKASHCGKD